MQEAISEAVHVTPGGPLVGLVDAYQGYRQCGVTPAQHLGLPSPYMTMIVTLEEPLELARSSDGSTDRRRFQTIVGGLATAPAVVVHDGAQSGIQLAVSPLASRALFGMPAGELADRDLHGDEVIGAAAVELWERIGAAPNWAERFAVLDGALGRRLRAAGPVSQQPPAPVCAAWRLLRASGGAITIARLAREVGWSERRLEIVFAREVGMSPKRAARLIRFDRVRHALQARAQDDAAPPDMARLAADCGYHDQPHLIRDFRSFTGLAPTAWLAHEFGNVQVPVPVAA